MSFVKEPSGIIINTDDSHYRSLVALRESRKEKARLESEVQSLKSDIDNIKDLVAQLVHRNN